VDLTLSRWQTGQVEILTVELYAIPSGAGLAGADDAHVPETTAAAALAHGLLALSVVR
jgi:hypothetical protein